MMLVSFIICFNKTKFKEDLSVVGGHMVPGCIVNTTCELVILAFDRYEFSKEFDQNTGYNELLIKEI